MDETTLDLLFAGPTSLLSATNMMLASIGQNPVTALDPSQSTWADTALVALATHDRLVQTKGMEANRERGWDIPLNGTGEAVLPSNTLHVDAAYGQGCRVGRLTQRGGKVYDRDNRTFILTDLAPIKVDITLRLPFEDLPEAARALIAIKAAVQFQAQVQSSSIVTRVQDSHVQDALTAFEQMEDDANRYNGITGNLAVQKATRGYRGGVRRR